MSPPTRSTATATPSDSAAPEGLRRATRVVISCEHGGNEVPAAYAAQFVGLDSLLATHRGWDKGALTLGREMADAVGAAFVASTTTRLLVDLNRSIGNPTLFSEATRPLARRLRDAIITAHYRPHRDAIESLIANAVTAGERVLHIASHSFTPVMDGVVRNADVTWLYDPRRPDEQRFSRRWQAALARRDPALRLRRNYPYEGKGDGLTALLRKRHSGHEYIGLELEINQRFVEAGGPAWPALRTSVVATLEEALGGFD